MPKEETYMKKICLAGMLLTLSTLLSGFIEDSIRPLPDRNEIPKMIHQIWIGPKPFPKKLKKHVQTWKKHHPTWKYKLWKDEDVKGIEWSGINKTLYELSWNYGMKSDVLRYQLLWNFGGLYVDVDGECLKPFDILVEKLSFFVGYLTPFALVLKGGGLDI